MLGDDFLSGLSLSTLPCLVGGMGSKIANLPSNVSHVEKVHLFSNEPLMMGLAPDTTVQQIRILTEVITPDILHMYYLYVVVNVVYMYCNVGIAGLSGLHHDKFFMCRHDCRSIKNFVFSCVCTHIHM